MDWCKRGFLSVDEVDLEYSCHGPAPSQAPTAFLLHEGLGCIDLWRDFPVELSDKLGCGVFVYSRQGYGASDLAMLPRPLNYMTIEAVNVLPKIIDLVSPKAFQLIGHSDGATIAAIYAGEVGHSNLRGITLIAPHFFAEDVGLAQIGLAKTAYETTNMSEKLGRYHKDPNNTFYGWNQSWLHPEFKSWNVERVIDNINVPILAIQGTQDEYGTLAQIEVIKKRAQTSVSELILGDCKHSPHLEAGRTVLHAIHEFDASVTR